MNSLTRAVAALAVIIWTAQAQAQDAPGATTGPVIKDFGPVMTPPEGSWNLDKNTHYKVSIDVGSTAEFPGDLNRKLVSTARFLNMHAQTGIPPENIEFAVVVHGQGANDFLTDEAYEKRFMEPNPNTQLLQQLHEAGVKIYLCSQTALFRGMAPEEFNPAVTMAVSAMTSHVRLQHEGYTLIPF